MSVEQPLCVGIVAGESSGDTLGAALMRDMKRKHPHITFIGIGGLQMQAEGLHSLFDMDRLAVMGIVEVFGRLRELFKIRDSLVNTFTQINPVDVFIGIDAPDFNLRVSAQLKPKGIKTVQYVSPSVWAWRQGRVHGIKAAIDLVLCLFPFEVAFYKKHGVAAAFVGHPLAQSLPLGHQVEDAKAQFNIAFDQTVIALLPGSRAGEIKLLAPLLFSAARKILAVKPEVRFLIPAINSVRQQQIEMLLASQPELLQQAATVIAQKNTTGDVGRQVMAASDIVLIKSGTSALEALFLARPMVVIYKVSWLTYLIARAMIKIDMLCLPNILAGKPIVTELIQGEITPQRIMDNALTLLDNPEFSLEQSAQLDKIHRQLQGQSAESAAEVILKLLGG